MWENETLHGNYQENVLNVTTRIKNKHLTLTNPHLHKPKPLLPVFI